MNGTSKMGQTNTVEYYWWIKKPHKVLIQTTEASCQVKKPDVRNHTLHDAIYVHNKQTITKTK